MLKESITYKDFNGEEQTEDFWFNLTDAELVEIELGVKGGSLSELLKVVIATTDGRTIIDSFKRVIQLAYGRRSPDGKRFYKSDEVLEDFTSTGAYSALFMKLATDADYASKFINGLMPGGNANAALEAANSGKSTADILRERSEANLKGHQKKADHEAQDTRDVPEPSPRSVTSDPPQELRSVTEPAPSPKVAPKEDLNKLTKAELMARLNAQSGN